VRIGVPRELKDHEDRVALTPAGAEELVRRGHTVLVEAGAGVGSRIADADYRAAGARIEGTAEAVWAGAELVLKVKEPLPQEYALLRPGAVLFTYLHLAADRGLTRELLDREVTAVAYETVQLPDGTLPLLLPMSEIAGRLAPQVGAHALLRPEGGRGVLMGGVGGVAGARVVVIGGGVSGQHATDVAIGMGAEVTLLDTDLQKLRTVYARHGSRVRALASTGMAIREAVLDADLVIGAVLVPGARAPELVDNDVVAQMRPGSVLVDIAVDQGGCFADTRPTTHADPTYRVHGSTFYCVGNMPAAVATTSTYALTNATLRYVLALADQGWSGALRADAALARGLNTHEGRLCNAAVGAAHGLPTVPVEEVLG